MQKWPHTKRGPESSAPAFRKETLSATLPPRSSIQPVPSILGLAESVCQVVQGSDYCSIRDGRGAARAETREMWLLKLAHIYWEPAAWQLCYHPKSLSMKGRGKTALNGSLHPFTLLEKALPTMIRCVVLPSHLHFAVRPLCSAFIWSFWVERHKTRISWRNKNKMTSKLEGYICF